MQLSVQGQDTYVYTGGRSQNATLPAIIFLHGAQNDHSVWGLQSRYFAHHGFAVLAPDLPAHGRSGGKALASIAELRDWVLALMDASDLKQAALAGHSMGALVALDTAAHAPQRVSRLAMLGIGYPMKVAPALLEAALHDQPRATTMVNVWSHSTLAPKPAAPGPGFWVQGMSARLMESVSARNTQAVFHTDLNACNAYSDGEQAASQVRCPALFMLGRQDMMTPARAAAGLRKLMPQAEVLMMDAGHQMMSEAPDAVLDGLRDFLQT